MANFSSECFTAWFNGKSILTGATQQIAWGNRMDVQLVRDADTNMRVFGKDFLRRGRFGDGELELVEGLVRDVRARHK